MPKKALVAKELAKLFGALSHPDRIRIIEELKHEEELDVQGLQEILSISHSRVSQHLGILRSHRLVSERREGRRHIYHLDSPGVASWILDGLQFIEAELLDPRELHRAVEEARNYWGDQDDEDES